MNKSMEAQADVMEDQQPPMKTTAPIGSERLSREGSTSSSPRGRETTGKGRSSTSTTQQQSPNGEKSVARTNKNLSSPRTSPGRRQKHGGVGSVNRNRSPNSKATIAAPNRSHTSGALLPLLDFSAFPSLDNLKVQRKSLPKLIKLPIAGKLPYAILAKKPTTEPQEFILSAADFPALPDNGEQASGPSSSSNWLGESLSGIHGAAMGESGMPSFASITGVKPDVTTTKSVGSSAQAKTPQPNDATSKQPIKEGIKIFPDGKVTNIPNSMIQDQFGMVGLLRFARLVETEPTLVSLNIGQDLTKIGVNVNSSEKIHPSFGGSLAESPLQVQDIDFRVPPGYMINHKIRNKLAPLSLTACKEDALFFIYYTRPGDSIQLEAAAELYSRQWRYHMEEKVWIAISPGVDVREKTSTYERGTYYFFDAEKWLKVIKEFHIDYSKLAEKLTFPTRSKSDPII